jgi:hypothetical protein
LAELIGDRLSKRLAKNPSTEAPFAAGPPSPPTVTLIFAAGFDWELTQALKAARARWVQTDPV